MLDLGTLQAHVSIEGVEKFKQSLEEASTAAEESAQAIEEAMNEGTDEFAEGMDEAAEDAEESSESMKKSFKKAALQIAAGFTAVYSAVKDVFVRVKGLTDSIAETGDEIDKNSQKMMISTDAYQEWSFVLERSGSDISALQRGMKNLQSAVDSNSSAFDSLGVSLTNADGSMKSTEDVLYDTFMALADVNDEQERYALASEIFGKKTAQELLPALNSGSDGIQEMMEYAHENNLIMGEEAVQASAEYQDAMGDLQLSTQGLKTQLGEILLPYITEFVNTLVDDVIPAIEKFTEDNDWLLPSIAGLTTAIIVFKAAMGISAIINGVSMAITAYKAANEGATIAQWALNAAMTANPIGLLIALIAGLVVAFVLLWKNSETFRNTLTNAWESVKKAVSNAVQAIRRKFDEIGQGIQKVIQWFTGLPGRITSAIGNLGSLLKGAGKNLMDGLFGGITAGWEKIKEKVSGMGSWIKEHKGPRDYDLKLLVENGQWIMTGLMDGINSSMPALRSQLDGVAASIQGTNFNATASLDGYTNGYALGSNDTTYNLYIDGARINDDKAIEGKFRDLLTTMARKGMM